MGFLGDSFHLPANPGNIFGGTSFASTADNPAFYDPLNLSGDANPKLNKPAMDPGSVNSINTIQNNLLKTPQENAAQMMQGTGLAGGIAGQGDNQSNEKNSLGGGGINGMSEAISRKAQNSFAKDKGRLEQQSKFQGQVMANNNINAETANAIAISNAENNVNSSMNQLALQANAARYQTVSGIMSGAGSFAGTMAGSNNHEPSYYGGNNYSVIPNASGIVGNQTTPNAYNQYGASGNYDSYSPTSMSGGSGFE